MYSECREMEKMERKYYLKFIVVAVAAAMAAVSCNKDEEDTREYMAGSVSFDFPSYAVVGQEVSSYVSGITTPPLSDLRYYWVSYDMEINETDTVEGQSITFHLPSEPGEYSITAYAQSISGEYYTSSSTAHVQVITTDPEAIDGWAPGTTTLRDERDGQTYRVRNIGNLQWFTQDLRYAGDGETVLGYPYDKSEGLDYIFGRLYSWNEATGGQSGEGLGQGPQGACPDGWSVPTAEDWEDLALAVGGEPVDFLDHWDGIGDILSAPVTVNGSAMWPYSPDNLHSNTYGWNAFPTGNSRDNYNEFENIGVYGMWWSSTLLDNGMVPYRFIYYNTNTCDVYYTDKDSYGVSVRCVRLISGN